MLVLEQIEAVQDIVIDGTHENFKGTPLEGQDFNIVIGDEYDRTTYTKILKTLMTDKDGNHSQDLVDKAIFILSVKEHDIQIGDETDFRKVLEIIYNDRKTLPQVLFNTMKEEINNYLLSEEKKSEELESDLEDTQIG